jgi:hypothetical protein
MRPWSGLGARGPEFKSRRPDFRNLLQMWPIVAAPMGPSLRDPGREPLGDGGRAGRLGCANRPDDEPHSGDPRPRLELRGYGWAHGNRRGFEDRVGRRSEHEIGCPDQRRNQRRCRRDPRGHVRRRSARFPWFGGMGRRLRSCSLRQPRTNTIEKSVLIARKAESAVVGVAAVGVGIRYG